MFPDGLQVLRGELKLLHIPMEGSFEGKPGHLPHINMLTKAKYLYQLQIGIDIFLQLSQLLIHILLGLVVGLIERHPEQINEVVVEDDVC
jgi:hypothetical protein